MTKILLVEDDKSLREIYGVRLLAEGYDIVSAGDGEEALAMAIKERPHLIVSDVMMPKISGFDMLDILRSTTETKDIKVIMMTALSSEDQRQRGEALGADRYLVKSQVGIEDVVRTVHDVLGDAPIAGAGGNVFMQPAAPRASTPVPPRPTNPMPVAPTQPTQAPFPVAPTLAPPAAPLQPQPPVPSRLPVEPLQPAATPTLQATPTSVQNGATSNLPQPTAPFSTNRPGNLGDRIIHPVEQTTEKRDFSNLLAQELGSVAPTAPAPAPELQPQQPSPMTTPKIELNFEETPLQQTTPTIQPPQQ